MCSALLGHRARKAVATGSASSSRSKIFLRVWSVDQQALVPVYQPVMRASDRERNVIQ
jgi:hypothetical protein